MKKKSNTTRSKKDNAFKKNDKSKTGSKATQSNRKDNKKGNDRTTTTLSIATPSTINTDPKEKQSPAVGAAKKEEKAKKESEKKRKEEKAKKEERKEEKEKEKPKETKETKKTENVTEEKNRSEGQKDMTSGMEAATLKDDKKPPKMDDGYEDFGPGV